MPLFQAKQIQKLIAAYVALTNQAVSSANSLNITSALTSALSTASNSGGSVPLNPSGSNSAEGVITGSGVVVPVYAYPAGTPISIAGNEVYGILTYATSVYTVSFYTLVAGVQTAAVVNQAVNLLVPYSFSFDHLPFNALMAVINADPGSPGNSGGTFYLDTSISVTGTNTISNLAKLPINPASVQLFVNGQGLAAGTSFSVSGQAITISAGQITANGYNITTTDSVYALYAY